MDDHTLYRGTARALSTWRCAAMAGIAVVACAAPAAATIYTYDFTGTTSYNYQAERLFGGSLTLPSTFSARVTVNDAVPGVDYNYAGILVSGPHASYLVPGSTAEGSFGCGALASDPLCGSLPYSSPFSIAVTIGGRTFTTGSTYPAFDQILGPDAGVSFEADNRITKQGTETLTFSSDASLDEFIGANGVYSAEHRESLTTNFSVSLPFTSTDFRETLTDNDLPSGGVGGAPYYYGEGSIDLSDSRTGMNADVFFNITGVTISKMAVPEPASWSMLILGFAAIGWQRRRGGKAGARALPLSRI